MLNGTKWFLLILFVLPFMSWGCGLGTAGTAAELLGYDAIIMACQEAQKGVVAGDLSEQKNIQKNKDQWVKELFKDIKQLAQEKMDPAKAEQFAQAICYGNVQENLTGAQEHLRNWTEWEARRAHLFSVTMGNLQYAIDISLDAKKFVLYKSSIEEQWKVYLMSQARSRLTVLKEPADDTARKSLFVRVGSQLVK